MNRIPAILIDSPKGLSHEEIQSYADLFSSELGTRDLNLVERKLFPPRPVEGSRVFRFTSLEDCLRSLERISPAPDLLVRVRTLGHPLPPGLLSKVLRYHLAGHNDYTFADGGRVMLYEMWIEVMNIHPRMHERVRMFPDSTIDFQTGGRKKTYLLDREDMLFYLRDHFDRLYAFPRNITIEVSTKCNLRCKMCFFYAPRTGSGLYTCPSDILSLEGFQRILDGLCESFGAYPAIDINGRGEPLLNPDLPGMIAYARGKGMTCSLTTNGTLLSSEISRQLLESGLNTLHVSLDASDERTYNAIRPPGDYPTLVHNIRTFLDLREKQTRPGTSFIAKMVLQDENREQHDAFVRQWMGLADGVHIWENCRVNQDGHRLLPGSDFVTPFAVCTLPWLGYFISLEGKAYPCCMVCSRDAYEFPYASREELPRAWWSPSLSDHRTAFLAGRQDQTPFCRACEYKSYAAALDRGYFDRFYRKQYNNATFYTRH